MRIGIDARFYGSLGKGLGRYVAELIAGLERLDDRNEYVVFLRAANFDSYEPKNPRFTKVLAEFPWYGWKEQLLFPSFLRRFKLDLVHFAHFNVPVLYDRPFVVTIHDLIMLRHPTPRATTLGPLAFAIKFRVYRWLVTRAIAAARAVITVSQWSKQDIETHFRKAKNKTFVTYEAAARGIAAASANAAPTAERPPFPFILYVGNAYPHKNLERLLDAFALFHDAHPLYRLILVGSPDYFYDRLRAEAAAKKLDHGVTFFGHATDEKLAELYATAAFYVFPSMHEGFGLPPLEAMAHGLPVAAADATCLPEILGDAAEWFDPYDAKDIARAMEVLAKDPARREELAKKGREQVARYDWDDCAKRTLAIYEQSVSKTP